MTKSIDASALTGLDVAAPASAAYVAPKLVSIDRATALVQGGGGWSGSDCRYYYYYQSGPYGC
jgi:hypothetical protein